MLKTYIASCVQCDAVLNADDPEWVDSHMQSLAEKLSHKTVWLLAFVCEDLHCMPDQGDDRSHILKAAYIKNLSFRCVKSVQSGVCIVHLLLIVSFSTGPCPWYQESQKA